MRLEKTWKWSLLSLNTSFTNLPGASLEMIFSKRYYLYYHEIPHICTVLFCLLSSLTSIICDPSSIRGFFHLHECVMLSVAQNLPMFFSLLANVPFQVPVYLFHSRHHTWGWSVLPVGFKFHEGGNEVCFAICSILRPGVISGTKWTLTKVSLNKWRSMNGLYFYNNIT